MNSIKKILLTFFITSLSIIILIYVFTATILFYIGPLETRTVKQNLEKNPANIVVSLTTTPDRINKIQPVLKSLYRQSIKPDRIYLNIPRDNNDDEKYIIPAWLKTDPKVIVNRTKDYGPAIKLIGTLEKEHDPDTIIITVDDNHIYPKHSIRDIVKQYLPGTYKTNYKLSSVVTTDGLNILFKPNFELEEKPITLGDRPSLNVLGSSVVAYKRKFFKDDIFSLMDNMPKSCFLSDDLMISAYLLNKGISIVKISGISYNKVIKELLIKELSGATTRDNWSYNYSDCLASLPKYNKTEYQNTILERSKTIYSLLYYDIFRVYIAKIYYGFLNKIVQGVPFVKTMIIATMS
jgi:hypothetical protein